MGIGGGDGLEITSLGFDDLQTAPQPTLGGMLGAYKKFNTYK